MKAVQRFLVAFIVFVALPAMALACPLSCVDAAPGSALQVADAGGPDAPAEAAPPVATAPAETTVTPAAPADHAAASAAPAAAAAVPVVPAEEATAPAAASGDAAVPPAPAPAGVNIYAETLLGKSNPVTEGALYRVYVPNHSSNTVTVIDPLTHKVIEKFNVGRGPQHITPSWDMKTIWVANTANQTNHGSMVPIDPKTGKPGPQIAVDDPYNLYFTPDGSSAIVVAEAFQKLEFRDPKTFELQTSVAVPICRGMNHADYSADFSFMILTCEFNGMPRGLTGRKNQTCGVGIGLIKIDMKERKLVSALVLSKPGMPQDIRLSPDGKTFYVTDMFNAGVFTIDAASFKETGFIPTGIGAHGLNVSRDSKFLYVANRGSKFMPDRPRGPGSVSVIEFASNKVVANWPIPGGGSPDMGSVTPDGKELWLSGRFDGQVYAFDTTTGAVTKINVGVEPHGLTVWPQPGRFSLGHTGNMR